MPHFDIIRKCSPKPTFRVASVMGTYDLQGRTVEERFAGDITFPANWRVGLIVGASGTGKTTIAKELFSESYIERFAYTHECILDDMPAGVSCKQIEQALTSVGLASIPTWLKPYSVLSNGEKMRCDLARAILSEAKLFVFDEFTSVVDRTVARVGSYAMQKAIRRTDKQFIAVTCHYDVEDWLLPDWVFDTDSMTFRLCEGQKKNRPKCELRIYETKQKRYYWRMFSRYHYLSHNFNVAARTYIATLNGQICAFSSWLPFPHPRKKNCYREHRLVVLPDFQGLNIGLILSNYIAEQLKREGKTAITTTSNPARIAQLAKSPLWQCTRKGRAANGSGSIQNRKDLSSSSCQRITVAFKYIGNEYDEEGLQRLPDDASSTGEADLPTDGQVPPTN